MTPAAFLRLAVDSVTAPQDVARLLLSLRWSREALLLSFALVVVLNALVFSATMLLAPPGDAELSLLASPMAFMFTLAGALALTIVAFTLAGRALGGTARIEDMAILMIWMQALRVLVQVAMVVVLAISSGLAALLIVATSALGIWILAHFINQAHGLDSLLRAVLVLLLGLTGTALALAFLLTLTGATTMGLNGYV